MSDYTPAPWKLEHLGEWWVAYGPGRVIFQVGAVDEIDEANARLIERAPEMDARIRELEAALRPAEDALSLWCIYWAGPDVEESMWPRRGDRTEAVLDALRKTEAAYGQITALLHPKGDA